jgi:hypothetical protein
LELRCWRSVSLLAPSPPGRPATRHPPGFCDLGAGWQALESGDLRRCLALPPALSGVYITRTEATADAARVLQVGLPALPAPLGLLWLLGLLPRVKLAGRANQVRIALARLATAALRWLLLAMPAADSEGCWAAAAASRPATSTALALPRWQLALRMRSLLPLPEQQEPEQRAAGWCQLRRPCPQSTALCIHVHPVDTQSSALWVPAGRSASRQLPPLPD